MAGERDVLADKRLRLDAIYRTVAHNQSMEADLTREAALLGIVIHEAALAALSKSAANRGLPPYEERQREVRDMIEEADRQDDAPMGPDGLADALTEIADGWVRRALAAPSPEPLPREALDVAIAAVEALPRWDKRTVPGGFHVNRAAVLAILDAAMSPQELAAIVARDADSDWRHGIKDRRALLVLLREANDQIGRLERELQRCQEAPFG